MIAARHFGNERVGTETGLQAGRPKENSFGFLSVNLAGGKTSRLGKN
jgi:hypothetical protein